MIVRPRTHYWQTLFAGSGAVLPIIWQPLLVFVSWSAIVVVLHREVSWLVPGHTPGLYTLLGVALSIFLSFRNNACYDRWWEGRHQWGHLVAAVRNFARQSLILEPAAPGERQRLLALVTGFCYALVAHLRPSFGFETAATWLSPVEQDQIRHAANRPDAIIRVIGQSLAELKTANRISDIEFQLLDHTIQQFVTVQGGCERVRSTPVPFSYNQLLRQSSFILLLGLPLGFIDVLGTGVILAELLLGYVFLGLDVLGDELEEPFGDQPNNLPIAALAKTIEIELRAATGETDLPPMPAPVDFIIM